MVNKFEKVHSVLDILVFVVILAVGCALALLPVGTSLNLIGCLVIPCALVVLFVLKSEYKNSADGGRYKKKVLYLPNNMEQSVTKLLVTNPEEIDVVGIGNSNSLRLDIYYSVAKGKAFLQLFKYVPYQYEPRTEIVEHSTDRISNLIK